MKYEYMTTEEIAATMTDAEWFDLMVDAHIDEWAAEWEANGAGRDF